MKITIQSPEAGEEEQIIVKCHAITPEIINALNALKQQVNMFVASQGSEIHRISPTEVFYIETCLPCQVG